VVQLFSHLLEQENGLHHQEFLRLSTLLLLVGVVALLSILGAVVLVAIGLLLVFL
jgi:hypothetical protein